LITNLTEAEEAFEAALAVRKSEGSAVRFQLNKLLALVPKSKAAQATNTMAALQTNLKALIQAVADQAGAEWYQAYYQAMPASEPVVDTWTEPEAEPEGEAEPKRGLSIVDSMLAEYR